MMDYPVMQQFYKFVATVWASDHEKDLNRRQGQRPNVQRADEADERVRRALIDAASQLAGGGRVMVGHTASAWSAAHGAAEREIAEAQAVALRVGGAPGNNPTDVVLAAAANRPPLLTAVGQAHITAVLGGGGPVNQVHDLAEAIIEASNAWTLALKEFDIYVKPNRVIHVHRNKLSEYHYVIPEPPATNPTLLEDWAERAVPYAMTTN